MTGAAVTWQAFVATYGWYARREHLAAVVGQPVSAIARIKSGQPGPRRDFGALFTLWHGRPARDDEWPRPAWQAGSYEWQGPERVLVARLVGHQPATAIARILTERLRRVTGDPRAVRTVYSVHQRAHQLGLTLNEVFFGGLTTRTAAKRAGVTRTLIHQEVRRRKLRHFRVGKRIVIPERALTEWQATRLPAPPPGWIKIYSIRQALGIAGDNIAWYAKQGLIPHARFCAGHRWWIPRGIARDLLARYRAGRPLPWHGGRSTHPSMVRRSWALWRVRRHRRCADCREIWKLLGRPPRTFAEFLAHYRTLDEATKRHLTMRDGITATRAAAIAGVDRHAVLDALRQRRLRARRRGGRWQINRADLLRWAGARRPRTRKRQRPGRALATAARRAGVSPAVFIRTAAGLPWRPGRRVPSVVVEEVGRRLAARWQLSFAAAARILRRPVSWVRAAIKAGMLRPIRASRGRSRRLGRKAVLALVRHGVPDLPRARGRGRPVVWLALFEAAQLAGVTTSTVKRWADLGRLRMTRGADGDWDYGKVSVERAAREYWATCRFKRATPPEWIQAERRKAA